MAATACLAFSLPLVGGVAPHSSREGTGAVFAAQHPTETSGRLWHQLGGRAWMLLIALLGTALLQVRRQPAAPAEVHAA